MGASAYTDKSLRKVCALLGVTHLREDKFPISPGDHPELDSNELLGEGKNPLYQQLVGMAEWMVQIVIFEI